MTDAYQDKLEQVRARRTRDSVQVGYNPYDSQQVGQNGLNAINTRGIEGINTDDAPLLDANFKSPWARDRITLSLDGQIAMIEQRGQVNNTVADLGYSNRNSSVAIRNGISVIVEPPGTYRMVYNR